MEKNTKKILKAKKEGNKDLVQRLQQEFDELDKINKSMIELKILRGLEDFKDKEDFPKDESEKDNS
tara:strand:- start:283 stop:480 length:198 start_codon:yes stop_codon:yes gene_type:complete